MANLYDCQSTISKFITRSTKIVDKCLSYDSDKRPTAETLVKACETLCYLSEERHVGRVNNLIQGGISGFIDGTPSNSFLVWKVYTVRGTQTPQQEILFVIPLLMDTHGLEHTL